jgi:hypothetical protein
MNERTKGLIQMADLCAASLMASGATEEQILHRAKVVLAELVRQDEREACAKVLEAISNAPDMQSYAAAIRARGEK